MLLAGLSAHQNMPSAKCQDVPSAIPKLWRSLFECPPAVGRAGVSLSHFVASETWCCAELQRNISSSTSSQCLGTFFRWQRPLCLALICALYTFFKNLVQLIILSCILPLDSWHVCVDDIYVLNVHCQDSLEYWTVVVPWKSMTPVVVSLWIM